MVKYQNLFTGSNVEIKYFSKPRAIITKFLSLFFVVKDRDGE
jgi:hypothetical protein